MRIVEYGPNWFDDLRQAVEPRRPDSALNHRPFVDYYYTSQDWCKLLLAIGRDGSVVGTLGVDRMKFESESGEVVLGFGSNYNSFVPGVGSFLFMRRLKECPLGLVFWTTDDTQKVIKSLGWKYFSGIRRYYLNYSYPIFPGDPAWRKIAKILLQRYPRRALGGFASRLRRATEADISVRSESHFTSDLLPHASPFAFRFAPSLDYLNWRYNTELSFVKYRIFRILAGQTTVGYVVINDRPDRLVVAQCDGVDPVMLAYGVMSSIVEVGRNDRHPRTVMLTTSHSVLRELYRSFGFRMSTADERFAVGGYRQVVTLNQKTSSWLINFDWGNNELQTPFLDQVTNRREGFDDRKTINR